MMCKRRRSARDGFTLIEVAVATAIVGVGVVALLTAITAGTRANGSGQDLTQAVFIAHELREWTIKLPFVDPDAGQSDTPPGPNGSNPQVFVDDLNDMMNVTYSPPRDARGNAITTLPGWSETITMTWRNPSNISQVVTDGASDFVYVSVTIFSQGQRILTTGWLVSRR
jgi:prepilin-type N-terminal cleavage/methylation domain-containing protein